MDKHTRRDYRAQQPRAAWIPRHTLWDKTQWELKPSLAVVFSLWCVGVRCSFVINIWSESITRNTQAATGAITIDTYKWIQMLNCWIASATTLVRIPQQWYNIAGNQWLWRTACECYSLYDLWFGCHMNVPAISRRGLTLHARRIRQFELFCDSAILGHQ